METISKIYGRYRLSLIATMFGLVFYAASLTPSLLPRSTLQQSITSAVIMATGYGIGSALQRLTAWIAPYKVGKPSEAFIYRSYIVFGIFYIFSGLRALPQLHEQQRLFSRTGVRINIVLVSIFALLGCLLLIYLFREIGKAISWLSVHIHRRITKLSLAYTTILAAIIIGYVIVQSSTFLMTLILEPRNNIYPSNLSPPTSSLRSGSQESLVSWDGLGRRGREFIASGPSQSDIRKLHDHAMEPIRIYIGEQHEAVLADRIKLAIAELHRTGAFERDNIVIFTPSGTGMVNSAAVDSVEYILAGDVASAVVQYSSVSSFLQYVKDSNIPKVSSEQLIAEIIKEIQQIHPDLRPNLFVYGESLGSLGSQHYFFHHDGYSQFIGGLWVGTPYGSELWSSLRSSNGDAVWALPEQASDTFRFSFTAEGLNDSGDWQQPRFAFLFNPTDPVVWASLRTAIERPALLSPKGPSQLNIVTWKPLITYQQMILELLSAASYGSGYGHSYEQEIPAAWIEVIQPPDWTSQMTQKLSELLISD